jgi:hypothetical protein
MKPSEKAVDSINKLIDQLEKGAINPQLAKLMIEGLNSAANIAFKDAKYQNLQGVKPSVKYFENQL